MTRVTVDGNEAAVSVAYRLNEVCCIYPITPSSPMAELADEWSSAQRTNVWGTVPTVVEMQSEGGAAGALHGALQSGALTTTFTSSQGLLLMIPNMYKIAGELTSAVIHVAARSLAAQGLSIFGDHSDVMAVRQTGFAMLASASVQEAQDLALIAQAATLASRVPFVHFFDGFRTSHEINTIETLSDDDLRALVPEELVWAHRGRALSPERPFIRGTAQNPDVYFQARETVNPFYARVPGVVQNLMARLGERTGRKMGIVDYTGHPQAERVLVVMGSGGQTVAETVAALGERGERVGVVQMRLYRPFPTRALLDALPATVRTVGVLDRTKEPGSIGEPLYLDVVAALAEAYADGERPVMPRVTGGRYGLSSKEFTPAMVAGVFAELAREHPRRRFTIGIDDDVSGTSVDYDPSFDIESPKTFRAVFFGLGSDGTVSANKNTIKIMGSEEGLFAQAYFVYDSKKSGSQTESHLRFGPDPIRRTRPGTRCPDGFRSRSSPRGSLSTPSMPAGSPVRSDWPGGSTSCCRRASSRSRRCCPGIGPSPGSRNRWKKRTATAAPTCCGANWPRSTPHWTGCIASRCRTWPLPNARRYPRCPRTRRSSCAP